MPAPRIKAPSQSTVEKEFKEFLAITDQVEQLELRKDELKARLLQAAAEKGQEDDKGSAFLELTAPLEFTDYRGRTHKYLSIKRERYLRPAQPTPDPTKAEALLRKLKLWLKPADEKELRDLQIRNPYVYVQVDVDVDALAQAYFKGIIDEDEYDACLQDQKEFFRFVKGE